MVSTTKPKILKSEPKGRKYTKIDAFAGALTELFFVRTPKYRKGSLEAKAPLEEFLKKGGIKPVWVVYLERGIAVKTLPEKEYFELRTARNRNLITTEEQKKFREATVGIAGLSVGSSIAAALAISGGPKVMKLADPDTLEISNLNRIRAGVSDVGRLKTNIIAEYIWNVDPFAELYLFDKGITHETLKKFILGKPRLDIFIDEMDNLSLKFAARMLCRAHGIPVLMATDNGDGVILDVERYDLDPKTPIFNGRVPERDPKELEHIDRKEWLKIATQIIGAEDMTERLRSSMVLIGTELGGPPQLGGGASIAGSVTSYAARLIVTDRPLASGRYILSSEKTFSS